MKKLIIILTILLIVCGGGFYVYDSIYNSKSVDLGVKVTDSDIASLDKKLQDTTINDETGVTTFTATLNEAETSVLFSRDLTTILPCEDVQVKLNEDQMLLSFMATLSDELVASINAPIPLPENASVYLECNVVTEEQVEVTVTTAKVADLPLPESFLKNYQKAIKDVFSNLGYEKIKVNSKTMDVTGIVK